MLACDKAKPTPTQQPDGMLFGISTDQFYNIEFSCDEELSPITETVSDRNDKRVHDVLPLLGFALPKKY